MTKGTTKAGHKYKSKKFVGGKWVYTYNDSKPLIIKKDAKQKAKKPIPKTKKTLSLTKPKDKIQDYYGPGRHKYFDSKEDKKDFVGKQKLGFTGGKGKKIKSTLGRIKIGTKVEIEIGKNKFMGRVIGSNGTKSKSPTKFDIEYYNSKKKQTIIKKSVPREELSRASKSYQQKKEEDKTKKELKRDVYREEGNDLIDRAVKIDQEIKDQAKQMVGVHWEMFQKIAGKYWKQRINGGWDASKFGFDYDDMKQEVYMTVYKAALSYASNPKRDNRATFKSYTLGFLKANMAAILAVNSGAGGHLKASAKDQIHLWFFKTTKDEFRDSHNGREPSDLEIMDVLNKKRKSLSNMKGNFTSKNYEWTIEKVRNKNSMAKRMESLDKVINLGDGRSDTLLSVLNDEELEIAGHYKMDPWKEAQKAVVKDEVRKAIKSKVKNSTDRTILIRTYGLFVDENSPISERMYAQGSTGGEIALALNQYEVKKGTKKRWTPGRVDKRLIEILETLRDDKDFKRKMQAFIKSTLAGQDEWPEVGLIMYWIAMHDIVGMTIDEITRSEYVKTNNEEVNNEIKFIVDKAYGTEIQEEEKIVFIKNKHVE